jgi:TRAP-type C4-dicarboxylate transport system substrate-binding protein
MTTTITRRALLGAAGMTATTAFTRPARAAEFELKLGVNPPDAHPLTARLTEAARAIGEQSSGRLNVTVFANRQAL